MTELATLKQPIRVEGVGPHKGLACAVSLLPAEASTGLVLVTEEETLQVHPRALEGGEGLALFGELSSVAGVEALLAALLVAGIEDLRLEVSGGEIPIGTLNSWLERFTVDGSQAREARPVVEALMVSSEDGYAALAPAEPAVAVRLEEGPGRTGEGLLPLDPAALAAELGDCRPVHLDLASEHLEERWLGLSSESAATRESDLRTPDEGLRWHMVCALAGLAVSGPLQARLELVGPDLDLLARVLKQASRPL